VGLLAPGQERFVGAVSRETGLNPRVVGSWALAEQSGSAARNYESRGYHNWLNIAQTDQGPAAGAHSAVWRNPLTAARATSEWLKGAGPITHEYGRAAPGILAILRAGSDPMAQINAIARSGWASSGYNGGADLRSLYSQLAGQKFPSATAGPEGASSPSRVGPGLAESLGIREGAEGSQLNPVVLSAIERLISQPAPEPLGQLARPAAYASPLMPQGSRAIPGIAANPEATLAAQLKPLIAQLTGEPIPGEPSVQRTLGPSGTGNALTNAVPHGTKLVGFLPGNAPLTVKRRDQGQDIQTAPNTPILAPGSGYVKLVNSNPGGFGISYPVVHFTSGPLKGHDIYIGHTRSALPQGAHFQQGQTLSHTGNGTGPYVGNATGLPGWAEIGLWTEAGPPAFGTGGNEIAPLLGL
jgi:hypothetical protein